MNQYAVTLKNLYRVLTVKDYPFFSNGVLSVREKSGMTLTSFWKSTLVPAWQYGSYGRAIWRKDRSRYLSDFCNRRDAVPFYKEYREEIFAALNAEILLEQMKSFESFLVSHRYDADVFFRKMEFILNASEEDDLFRKGDDRFFLRNVWLADEYAPEGFLCAEEITHFQSEPPENGCFRGFLFLFRGIPPREAGFLHFLIKCGIISVRCFLWLCGIIDSTGFCAGFCVKSVRLKRNMLFFPACSRRRLHTVVVGQGVLWR